MFIPQITVFLENKPGSMYELIKLLADKGFDVKSVMLADTSEYGLVRLIVSDASEVLQLLNDNGFTAGIHEVLAIPMVDPVNNLAKALLTFKNNNLNVEYMYVFTSPKQGKIVTIFKLDDLTNVVNYIEKEDLVCIPENLMGTL